jgi:hypothetical protein
MNVVAVVAGSLSAASCDAVKIERCRPFAAPT